jgi:hypothetical protein
MKIKFSILDIGKGHPLDLNVLIYSVYGAIELLETVPLTESEVCSHRGILKENEEELNKIIRKKVNNIPDNIYFASKLEENGFTSIVVKCK